MLEFAVFADDLTGGMIIASLLEGLGVRCPLVTSADALDQLTPDVEAVVLARKVRLIAPELARAEAQAAAAAFQRRGARRIFYKYSALFDSTPAGNIGPIAETLLAATGARRTLFCPSFVERDVAVYEGRMFVRGAPLNETFKRFDPVTPMHNANLVEVLQAQTARKVGLLRRRILARGAQAAAAELERQADTPFFIADAIDDQDIGVLAELAADWPLTTGGDSLPPALVRRWRAGRAADVGSARRLLPGAAGFEAVLSGSCAGQTLAQLEALERRCPIWRIDLARDGADDGLIERLAAWAAPRLADGPLAIATSADQAGVAAAQARYGADGAAALADRILGQVARRLSTLGVTKFVVAGGETSGAVLDALGVREVQVAAFDDMQGGYCAERAASPRAFVLKPGTFGDEDFLMSALARLREAAGAATAGERETGHGR